MQAVTHQQLFIEMTKPSARPANGLVAVPF